MTTERELRALRRRSWPGGLTTEHRAAQLETPEERLATMWQLALDACSLSGASLPDYGRATIPGRLIRIEPVADALAALPERLQAPEPPL